MIVQALEWIGRSDGFLELTDQRRLPAEFVKIKCTQIEQVYDAIRTLAIRGAPAIGVAAAYGLVLGMQKPAQADDSKKPLAVLAQSCEYLASARPTAVNLSWALERIKRKAEESLAGKPQADSHSLREFILAQAHRIRQEDIQMCRRIGVNGQKFIEDNAAILTHCNAGALATAGQGTALSLMFEAQKAGKKFSVYADETRPLLQGARLTAWELLHAGIDVTVICDNMAGWLMKLGRINAVITGADRIAANGDTANKIGTYPLSILAREHGIPLYVAAPSSTFDLTITSGTEIPIEERSPDEVMFFGESKTAPDGVKVFNPAFDITQAADITAIVTERGVIEKPTARKIADHLKQVD